MNALLAPQEPLPSDNASCPSPSRPITPSDFAETAKSDRLIARIIHEGWKWRFKRGRREGHSSEVRCLGANRGVFLLADRHFRRSSPALPDSGRAPPRIGGSVRQAGEAVGSGQVATAPIERAMRRQSSANGVPTGRWMTIRRTDVSIQAPSFSRRCRNNSRREWATFDGSRSSDRHPANVSLNRSRSSQALSRIAPPSELAGPGRTEPSPPSSTGPRTTHAVWWYGDPSKSPSLR